MGSSISCDAFTVFSTFWEWCVREKFGDPLIAHYLVDFLLSARAGAATCQAILDSF